MISIIPNFLSHEEVNTILNYAKDEVPNEWNSNEEHEFWRDRVLQIHDKDYQGPKDKLIVDLLMGKRNLIKQRIIEICNITVPVYGDTLQIVRWPEGYEQEPHADGEQNNPEDGEHPFPHRFYASVCYLNNDFDGGEIYFPQHDIELKPVPGTMVTFPGTREYLHGVRPVANGVRYTVISFYTKDISKADRLPN